ncbi:hypothetical protein VUR80DRAFT_2446 [Thermomyces stellatus]
MVLSVKETTSFFSFSPRGYRATFGRAMSGCAVGMSMLPYHGPLLAHPACHSFSRSQFSGTKQAIRKRRTGTLHSGTFLFARVPGRPICFTYSIIPALVHSPPGYQLFQTNEQQRALQVQRESWPVTCYIITTLPS